MFGFASRSLLYGLKRVTLIGKLSQNIMKCKTWSVMPVRYFKNSNKPHRQLVPIDVLKNSDVPIDVNAMTEDKGMSDFIMRTYVFTGGGVTATLGLSQAMSMVQTSDAFFPMLGAGLVISIGGILGISFSKYQVYQLRFKKDDFLTNERPEDTLDSFSYLYSKNSATRLLSYGALVTGMSMTLSPMLYVVNGISVTILPVSVLLTVGVFSGSIMYAWFRPKGTLLALEAPLMGGLVGLIGMGFVELGSQCIFGPNVLSAALYSIDTYCGLALFTTMTAYDTQKAITMYEDEDPDHLGCSVNLHLDFMNLVMRFMEIMTAAQQQKK